MAQTKRDEDTAITSAVALKVQDPHVLCVRVGVTAVFMEDKPGKCNEFD